MIYNREHTDMKVAHFTDTFYPSLNGVVTSVVNLSKALTDQGHSVTIFAPHPPHDKDLHWDYPEIKLELLPSMPALFYPDFRLSSPLSMEVLRLMNEDQPDIIHFHTPLTVGFAGILIGKMKKIPVVGTFHTYFMEPEYLQVVLFLVCRTSFLDCFILFFAQTGSIAIYLEYNCALSFPHGNTNRAVASYSGLSAYLSYYCLQFL
jgi:glycosyltransferase involved in cell wall biosynthesis